jgi:peptidoglycan/LPS O-acetylase OafA/YrhL
MIETSKIPQRNPSPRNWGNFVVGLVVTIGGLTLLVSNPFLEGFGLYNILSGLPSAAIGAAVCLVALSKRTSVRILSGLVLAISGLILAASGVYFFYLIPGSPEEDPRGFCVFIGLVLAISGVVWCFPGGQERVNGLLDKLGAEVRWRRR